MLVVWMLVMVAYVTSTITSTMTVEKLKASHISGVADLPGRPVGTLAGTSIVPSYLALAQESPEALAASAADSPPATDPPSAVLRSGDAAATRSGSPLPVPPLSAADSRVCSGQC
jgi:hypothetical protein